MQNEKITNTQMIRELQKNIKTEYQDTYNFRHTQKL